MSESPNKTDNNIFDEATIQFFRIPEAACEYIEEEEEGEDDQNEQEEEQKQQQDPPRIRISGGIKKSIDTISLIACRRQGVVPSTDLVATKKESEMSWAEKQNRIGLLRVLALERARVASELHDVLEKENDPNARLKMEQELKLVQREIGGELFVADPDEEEMIKQILSPHSSGATTAAIQNRMIDAVRRRSERAVARMYRSHDRIMQNEQENHEKRVELVQHLQEREQARVKLQKERKKELHQKVVEQQELREKKMSALRIRFAVLNEAKKQELEDKIKHSDQVYEDAQRRQVGHLIERSDKQHEKIMSVQEQVARSRREEWQRRNQLDEERRQKDALHRERREEIQLKKELRLEQRRQRGELLQVRAKELRDAKDEEMRKEFAAAHADQLNASRGKSSKNSKQGSSSNRKTASGGTSPSRPGTATNDQTPNNSRARALAYSRPSSQQKSGSRNNNNNNNGDENTTTPTAAKGTDYRRRVYNEEMLRRQLMIQIQEQHNAKILEERRIEVEAQRRVRQREEQEKMEHNRENLRRKERADQHRHQLQQMMVEEAEAAARQREKERLKAERKLQLLKLDLAKQREEAQERIREQEKKAHLNDSARNNNNKKDHETGASDDNNNSPTPSKSGRASVPPSSDSRTKPTPQNSAIMAVIAGGKKK